jgi:hypothetical protein
MSTASAPSPRCRTIIALTIMPRWWLRRYWSALVVPLCVATWPIEEMPHDDVAGCSVELRVIEGSRWAPLSRGDGDMRCMPWSGLTFDEKGRFLPTWLSQRTIYITIVSSKLLLSILPDEYETLIVGGLVRSGEGDVDDHRQVHRITSGGALSKAVVY